MKQLLLIECFNMGSMFLTHLEAQEIAMSMDDKIYDGIVEELKNPDIWWSIGSNGSEDFPDIEGKYKCRLSSMITNKDYPIYLNSQEELDRVNISDINIFYIIRGCQDPKSDILPKEVRDILEINELERKVECAAMQLNR